MQRIFVVSSSVRVKTPRCRVFHNAAQSIANNSTSTLSFNSERWDTDTMHDTVTNNSRITVNKAGLYALTASVEWATNATGIRWLIIRMNLVNEIVMVKHTAAGTNETIQNISTQWDAVVGDFFEVRVFQNSGGALDINTAADHSPEFMMARIGQ